VRLAYLINRNSVGGGMEYIRRQMAAHPKDETCVFFSERGECTAAKMNAWGAEVIHVNHLKALLQLFRNPFVRPHGRVIFTVHGIHLRKYDFLPKSFLNRTKRLVRLSLERWLYRKCDQLIALTETDAEDIKRLYGENLPVVVEANSLDVSCLKPPVGLRYGESEFAFVCIARFDFQKGQDILVKAIDLAQKELRASGKRTLLIGGGATLEETKRFVIEKGISDLVEFAGEIPDAGVYMTCARVLVAPSRWEGMPYLLLEAVARERSIIASDCPGNRDILRDCSNAKMFPVEDSDRLAELMVENVV
jgi:glycosyltransferase involved in cell wall biosynthesis